MTSAILHPYAGARTSQGVTFLTVCLAFALFLAVLVFARTAHACPSCAEGIQARSDVLQDGFGQNLFVALLPFVIIGGICLRAEDIGRRGPVSSDTNTDRGPSVRLR